MEKKASKRRQAEELQKEQQKLLKKALQEPGVAEVMELVEMCQAENREAAKLTAMTRVEPKLSLSNGTAL